MSDGCPICGDTFPHHHEVASDDTQSVASPDVVTADGAEVTMLWDLDHTRILLTIGAEDGPTLIVATETAQRVYEGDEDVWFQLAHRLRNPEGRA